MSVSVRPDPSTRWKADIPRLVNRILSLVEAHKEPLPIGSYLHEPYVSLSMSSPRRSLRILVAWEEAHVRFDKLTIEGYVPYLSPIFTKPLSESVAALLRIHRAFPTINVIEMLQTACTELERRLEERKEYQREIFSDELYQAKLHRLEEYAIYGMMTYPHLEVPQRFRNHEQLYWASAYLASLLLQIAQAQSQCRYRISSSYPAIVEILSRPYHYPGVVWLSISPESFTYTYISRTSYLSRCEVSEMSDVSRLPAELAEVLRFDPYMLCEIIEAAQGLQRPTRSWSW